MTPVALGDSNGLRGNFVLTVTVSGLNLFFFIFKTLCLVRLWGKGVRNLISLYSSSLSPSVFLPPLPVSPSAALPVTFSLSLFFLLFLSLSQHALPSFFPHAFFFFLFLFLWAPTLSSSVRYQGHQWIRQAQYLSIKNREWQKGCQNTCKILKPEKEFEILEIFCTKNRNFSQALLPVWSNEVSCWISQSASRSCRL